MNTETRIVYVARDGRPFFKASECASYEASLPPSFKMYMRDAKPTDNPHRAAFVHLDSDNSAIDFIDLCLTHKCSCPGIEPYDLGWFFWDEGEEKYIYADPGDIDNLYHLIHEDK